MIKIEINEKYRTGFMPHWGISDITITKKFGKEITQWLEDRNITQYEWSSSSSSVMAVRAPFIFFENEKDAIIFKMVWN